MEAVRFEFYLCLVFASVFATSLIAVLTGASPSLLWILAMVLGIAGAVWFYFMAYFYNWSAYQFEVICWGILIGRLRSPEQVIGRWIQLLEAAKKTAPMMHRLTRMGIETFDVEKASGGEESGKASP